VKRNALRTINRVCDVIYRKEACISRVVCHFSSLAVLLISQYIPEMPNFLLEAGLTPSESICGHSTQLLSWRISSLFSSIVLQFLQGAWSVHPDAVLKVSHK